MKKYLIYISIVLLTVFSFNMSVDAAISTNDITKDGRFIGKTCSSISESDLWITPFSEGGKYVTSCLYTVDVDTGCMVVQMDVRKLSENSFNFYFNVDYPFDIVGKNGKIAVTKENDFNDEYMKKNNGDCPAIQLSHEVKNSEVSQAVVESAAASGIKELTTSGSVNLKTLGVETPVRVSAGENFITAEIPDPYEIRYKEVELTCDNLFGEGDEGDELKGLIKTIYNLIRILIPLLLIGMGILDFAKAIFAGDEDKMKKATTKFMQRILIAVAIFLVPVLLRFVLSIAHEIWGILDPTFCGILD